MRSLERPQALIDAAKQAGMKVPADVTNYDKAEFPHWHVFVAIQIGRPLANDDSHFKNAKTIASADRMDLSFSKLVGKIE